MENRRVGDRENTVKQSNIHMRGIPGEESKNKAEMIFRDIMAENFAKMLKNIKP